jgi:hypothetical protein
MCMQIDTEELLSITLVPPRGAQDLYGNEVQVQNQAAGGRPSRILGDNEFNVCGT